MNSSYPATEIVAMAKTARAFEEALNRAVDMAVFSVDLVNSTPIKGILPQRTWLPTICEFLGCVTEEIRTKGGRIIKYIGDEVFSVIEDPKAFKLEDMIYSVHERVSGLRWDDNSICEAKIALDYGKMAPLTLDGREDVLGPVVDRCSRISRLCSPQTTIASEAFVRMGYQKAWRSLGAFDLKGFSSKVELFQFDRDVHVLSNADIERKITDGEDNFSLRQENKKLKEHLERLQDKLNVKKL